MTESLAARVAVLRLLPLSSQEATGRPERLGGRLVPIEVKLSATPRPAMASGIRAFQRDLGSKVGAGYVIHPGDVRLPLGPQTIALPFSEL